MKKTKVILLLGLLLVVGVVYYSVTETSRTDEHQDGVSEVSEPLVYKDLVRLESPLPESKITSPLLIKGEARGQWYFEASFPIVLTNWDGLIIAEGFATAQSDWMTTDFVPFTAELTFTVPEYGDNGFLILHKDNPSALPEFDDALEFQVFFR